MKNNLSKMFKVLRLRNTELKASSSECNSSVLVSFPTVPSTALLIQVPGAKRASLLNDPYPPSLPSSSRHSSQVWCVSCFPAIILIIY